MLLSVDNELLEIFGRICSQGWNEESWADHESCDMFQSESFCGGFDATEMEFVFSYYIGGAEFWFQVSLAEVREIVANGGGELELYRAE